MNLPVPTIVFIAVLGLLAVGLYSLLIARNLIKVVIALQILVKGALLALVIAGRINGQLEVSQTLALTVIVADTVVAVVGLAFAVQIRRCIGTLDIRALTSLKR